MDLGGDRAAGQAQLHHAVIGLGLQFTDPGDQGSADRGGQLFGIGKDVQFVAHPYFLGCSGAPSDRDRRVVASAGPGSGR